MSQRVTHFVPAGATAIAEALREGTPVGPVKSGAGLTPQLDVLAPLVRIPRSLSHRPVPDGSEVRLLGLVVNAVPRRHLLVIAHAADRSHPRRHPLENP